MADIDSMSKKQLEAFARKELDIELDRRHNKKDLLKRVKSELKPAPSEKKESAPIIKEDSTSTVKNIAETLNFDPYVGVIAEARAQVGDDLVKVKEHIEFLNNTSQENYQLILTEIDKYKD